MRLPPPKRAEVWALQATAPGALVLLFGPPVSPWLLILGGGLIAIGALACLRLMLDDAHRIEAHRRAHHPPHPSERS